MSKAILRLFAALPFVALLAMPAHAANTAPIYTPEPIQVPSGKNAEAVKNAVRKALFDRGWEVREIGAGHLQGKHTKSGGKGKMHVAVLDVRFDSKSVRIGYKDSQELNYDKESGVIHKTYNNWVRNLERNIRANLGAY
ncbi:MAG TPA: hypothetical protein VJ437_11680 [Acidiferrobacterales bacterium]|nr:hypothetical protein [Acidiferrobacterales bacterium]